MTRMKADEETLVLGRVSRMLEQMEDARAQARIATYIFHRFTVAGEQILPTEDRIAISGAEDRQLHLPTVAVTRPANAPESAPVAPTRPATTAGQETGATGAQSATPEPVDGGGWNLSGDGSDADDGPADASKSKKLKAVRAAATKAPKVTAVDGGWEIGPDEEIEVKI